MFTRSFLAALFSAIAYAQSDANPFKIGREGLMASAGQSLNLEWNPTTQGTVSLILRQGASGNLEQGTPIASNIDNSGSYTWNVPSSIVRGSDYTIEIVSDSNPSETNFTPQFVVDSSNTTPASTSGSSMASSAMSTSAASMSPSAFPLPPGVTIDTVAHSSTASSMSESASMTESSMSATGSSMSSTMATGTSSRATSSRAPSATGDAVSTGVASQTGAAARATAAAGFLGVVALGALAL